MIARSEARVAEGEAVIFLTYHGTNARAHRARCGMKIGARNRLKDRIVDVKDGASPARLLRNRQHLVSPFSAASSSRPSNNNPNCSLGA
jgi:hypothetical protein